MLSESFLVSGATGFLGSRLIEQLRRQGHQVWELSSRQDKANNRIYFKLGQKLELPAHIEVPRTLIHCAHDFNDKREASQNINFLGSQQLFQEACEIGIEKIIFVTSMSSHQESKSCYGKTKYLVEQELRKYRNVLLVRPGFIIGPGGVCSKLVSQIESLPILPIFFGSQPIQIIDIDRLMEAMKKSIIEGLSGELNLACEPHLETQEFYMNLCHVLGLPFRPIKLPGEIGLQILKAFEAIKIKLPLSSDNLLGLKSATIWETKKSWSLLGMPHPSSEDCLKAFVRNLK